MPHLTDEERRRRRPEYKTRRRRERTAQQIEEECARNRERRRKWRAARSEERSSKSQRTSANQSNATESVFASSVTVSQPPTENGAPILHITEKNLIVNRPAVPHLQPSQVPQMHNDYRYSHIRYLSKMVPGQLATHIQGAGSAVMVDFHSSTSSSTDRCYAHIFSASFLRAKLCLNQSVSTRSLQQ